MRRGDFWHENSVDQVVKNRIDNIIERLKTINFEKDRIDEKVVDVQIKRGGCKNIVGLATVDDAAGVIQDEAGHQQRNHAAQGQ